jgi:hypothetical protein
MFFPTHFRITHPNPTSSPSAMGTRWQAGGLRRSGHSRGHRRRQAPSMVRRGGCAEGWGRGREGCLIGAVRPYVTSGFVGRRFELKSSSTYFRRSFNAPLPTRRHCLSDRST